MQDIEIILEAEQYELTASIKNISTNYALISWSALRRARKQERHPEGAAAC